jgi:hypothetical protein
MKINKKDLFLTLLLPIQIVLVQIAGKHPAIVERYYSDGFYPIIAAFFRILFGWIPFSFGDVVLASLLFWLLRFIYKLIKNRAENWVPKMLQLTAVLSVLYGCFYLFWGLNYYRMPLAKNLGYDQTKYTTQQLIHTTEQVIEQLNFYQQKIAQNDSLRVINPYSQQQMYEMAMEGYQNLAQYFPTLNYKHPSVKSSLMSGLQSYMGTGGYFNPLSGEAQINERIPKTGYPTTICHEMAHQIGYAAENEANFIGFLAANYNEDLYFKYASYRMAFGYLITEVRKRDPKAASELWQTPHLGILKDFQNSYQFWKAYQNPFEPWVKKGYDAYLKANKQEKGTDSYNYVVDLLISYFELNS